MQEIKGMQAMVEAELSKLPLPDQPKELYEPIRYFMGLGGKRMRPVLLLMAHQMFGGDPAKVLGPACAIEVFHNFTLVHDDIMDEAPLRRGKVTVHEKWNTNIAILSGDAMLVKAYDQLLKTDPVYLPQVLDTFNQTGLQVCEGQQFDMDFESRDDVTIDEYINMIRLKTAVLLGGALKIGAITAGASEEATEAIRLFGEYIGISFQLQDDLLDVYGDQEKFGKQVGGDIIANKKTYMMLKAFEMAGDQQTEMLSSYMSSRQGSTEKVAGVVSIYNDLGVKEAARAEMEMYHQKGIDQLNGIGVAQEAKKPLLELAHYLLHRDF